MREAIEELLYQLFDEKYRKTLTDEDIAAILGQNNVFIFTAKDEEDNIVGLTTLYVVNLFSRKLGVIEEVVTLKEFRNRGIGSSLVNQAIEKARELSCDCIELCVRDDKPTVKAFYEKIGFKDRNNASMRLWLK